MAVQDHQLYWIEHYPATDLTWELLTTDCGARRHGHTLCSPPTEADDGRGPDHPRGPPEAFP